MAGKCVWFLHRSQTYILKWLATLPL
jgi:hypothetical protein